jgi:translation initiation factor 3 subunit E
VRLMHVFPSGQQIYDDRELLEGKLNLLKSTNMVDFAIDVYRQLHGENNDPPQDFLDKRQRVVADLKELSKTSDAVIEVMIKDEVQNLITQSRDNRQLFEVLQKEYGLTQDMVDGLYKYAKLQYDCGNYSSAAQYLSSHRILISPSDKNYLNNMWGKLASEILMQQWENALADFNRLRDYIDTNPFPNTLQSLQQRTWLIHWSLFIFFNHADGRDMLIDLFLSKQPYQKQHPYLNAVQTICPHILRYLTAAVITNRRRRELMKDLVKVIQSESYQYRDPFTEFVECLCVHFDFDGAQRKLRECADVFANDFFLVALQDSFIEHARLFVFEIFCQIHECISIKMLADKLNMTEEEAERWIVNLIRHARLDAKIDSKLGHVVMGTQAVSPYQQLIEKTKAMTIRCQVLSMNIEKKLALERSTGFTATDF